MWHPYEINIAYNDNLFLEKSYIVFKSNNYQECLKYLENYQRISNQQYSNYTITEIRKKNTLNYDWLQDITQNWEKMYYIIKDEYFVLSNSYKNIKSLINNMDSQQTIAKSPAMNTVNNKLGNKSHTSFYLNFKNSNSKWKKIFNSIVSKNIASKDYFFNSIILLYNNRHFENLTE